MDTKQIETRVVVALALVVAGYKAPEGVNVRRACEGALMNAADATGQTEAVEAVVDVAGQIDKLGVAQAQRVSRLARDLAAYAEKVAANPTAMVTNPADPNTVAAIAEGAARIEEKTQHLAQLIRLALGGEAAMAVSKALTTG